MRFAIVLGRGAYADEREGARSETGPRKDFLVIADRLGADILSYRAGRHLRGDWFERCFGRRPIWGSAVHAALLVRRYDRLLVSGEDVGFRLALLLKPFGIRDKLVCIAHHVNPGWQRMLRWMGHRAFRHFVIVSEAQRQRLLDSGVPDGKIVHVFDCVDDLFYGEPLGVTDAAVPVIVACGAENRDYATLAEAVRRLDAELHIYGTGFWGVEMAGRPGSLPDNVRMMPRVTYTELRTAMQQASVLAVPLNPVDYAAGVNGLMEALTAGPPVVASRSPGLIEYLAPLAADCVVPPGDAPAMAAALSAALAQRETADEAARRRAWVVQHCAMDRYAERIERLLRG